VSEREREREREREGRGESGVWRGRQLFPLKFNFFLNRVGRSLLASAKIRHLLQRNKIVKLKKTEVAFFKSVL
jgi:hypothetical protein